MKSRHYFVLIAMCGLAAASIGVAVKTAGVFYTPIAEDLGAGRGSVAMMVTILSIVAAIVAMFVPKMLKESTLKLIILTGTVLLAGGTYLISLSTSLPMIYILSIIRGIGDGLIHFVLVTMIINFWFYARRGLFTSIVMAFSGVPGVLLSPFFTNIISTSGWRTGMFWAAITTVICCLPAIVLPISIRPETQGLKAYGWEEYEQRRKEGLTVVISDMSSRFNYLNPKFLLAMVFTIMCCIVTAVPQHLPGYAVSIGKTANVGALMLSVAMAFNIISKLIFGILNDKIGSYKTVFTMVALNIAGIMLLLFVPMDWALYAGSALFAFTFSVSAVGVAMTTGYLFGMERYASAYPALNFIGGVANAIGAALVGSLYDMTGTYTVNFWLSLGCQTILILALAGAVALRKKERHSGIETN